MRTNHEERIDTTLGDLIVALNDAASEICEDERVAYFLTGLALREVLKTAHLKEPVGNNDSLSEADRHH